jgi:plastocyanin
MSRRILASILAVSTLLLLVVVVPATVSAGGGCHRPDGSVYTEGTTTVVKMDVCSFAPTIARAPVGAEVRFLNSSNIEHMVVGRSGTWASDMLSPGKEFSAQFTTSGTYPFSCPLHPGMVGAIVVGDAAPAAAVTTDSTPAAAPPEDAPAPATATETDSTPVAIAALGGLAAGAIVGTIIAGALLDRRRSSHLATD